MSSSEVELDLLVLWFAERGHIEAQFELGGLKRMARDEFLVHNNAAKISPGDRMTSSEQALRPTTAPDSWPLRRAASVETAIATSLTVLAMLTGLALRWVHLGKLSLWWDEGFTAWASSLSPAEIVRFSLTDNQPPLYYLLLHYWQGAFGTSESALRGLSAFFGTLSLPAFYLLARRVLKDRMAAALGIWLFAFAVKQIWYSREARAYEAASFFALLGLYALILFLEKSSVTTFVTIVLAVAASLYMHNMMFFYLFALNATWFMYPSGRSWMLRVKEILLFDIAVGALYLPWALNLFRQVAAVGGNLWWVRRPTIWTVVGTLRDLAGFELSYLFAVAERLLPMPERIVWLCVLGGVCLLGVALAAGSWRGVSRADRLRDFSLLSYGLLPILVVFVLSQKMPLYLDRVFTTSSLVVPLVFAFPLAVQKGTKARTAFGLIGIVLMAATALSAIGFLRYREAQEKNNEDWRGAVESLLGTSGRDRLIVFVPPGGEILFDYYARIFARTNSGAEEIGLPAGFYETFPHPKARIIDDKEINRLKLALGSKSYSEVDLVVAHNVDPQGLLLDYLDEALIRQEDRSYGDSVTIVRFVSQPH